MGGGLTVRPGAALAVAALLVACGGGVRTAATSPTATMSPASTSPPSASAPPATDEEDRTTVEISYARSGAADRESLAVADDGALRIWRSVGASAAGRFGGTLDDAEARELSDLATDLAEDPPPSPTLRPGAPRETVRLDGGDPIDLGSQPTGGWLQLRDLLRALLDRRDEPAAAIALEVAHDHGAARLVHRGPEPLRIDTAAAAVSTVTWGGHYEQRGSWSGTVQGGGVAEAGPGWVLDLPFDHGTTPGADEVLHTTVALRLYDGEAAIDVQLVDAPPLPGTG